jgi:outer membrane lipoprotein-sorting protein
VRDQRTGKSQKLGVRLVATRGGRLYLKGSVAVVTALEVVADGDRFWFQVPSKKTVWTGSSTASTDSERADAPYFALRPSDVVSAFLPEALSPGAREALTFEADRASFSLSLAALEDGAGRVRQRVWLERESLQWSRSRSFDAHGELVREVSLAGWQSGHPRQVTITRPGEGYVAAFSLDKLEVNVRVPERAFTPRTPEGYRVVEVR